MARQAKQVEIIAKGENVIKQRFMTDQSLAVQ